MALVAVFLVFVGFNYLKVDLNLPSNNKDGTANMSFEADNDWDDDGLINKEESYWNTDPNKSDTDGDGYLDGEEIASGHDPLIAGPDDFLPTDDNLTQKLSSLTLAGLYAGSLRLDSPDYEKSVNDLASSIVDSVSKPTGIKISKPKIVKSTKENIEQYFDDFFPILNEFISTFDDQVSNLFKNLDYVGNSGFDGKVVSYFTDKKSQFEKIRNKSSEINVPEGFEQQHIAFLKIVSELIAINEAGFSGDKDPIQTFAALKNLPEIINRVYSLINSYEKIFAI